jgi:hypothetical protein
MQELPVTTLWEATVLVGRLARSMVCVDIDVWTKLSPRSLYQYLLEEPSHREAWVPFLHSPSQSRGPFTPFGGRTGPRSYVGVVTTRAFQSTSEYLRGHSTLESCFKLDLGRTC